MYVCLFEVKKKNFSIVKRVLYQGLLHFFEGLSDRKMFGNMWRQYGNNSIKSRTNFVKINNSYKKLDKNGLNIIVFKIYSSSIIFMKNF